MLRLTVFVFVFASFFKKKFPLVNHLKLLVLNKNRILIHTKNSSLNSHQQYSLTCTQINGFKYCYVSLTIQLNIIDLFAHSEIIKQFYF